ncbi:DNA polymerase-3 subunit gamma/tau [Sphingopyxis sp. OAS728]|uniref:DNA polymerase III subunit gamma/tau n=1 Tax=Sphingopyxis sp. OAS728 TaxID=2663823 RepID=UPI0017899973|nr:DNA polymerase III subunit gamma/tau [Sphingopyxis sp. OAS728]MBE1525618.1 DNA polymerase-3 subunit gamma/tau [Sphingopyxis sp. OAS728]
MSDSADDETPMLGMDLPETTPQPSSGPYRVLARKYRPQTFAELIGQDAMVRTLGNAIARDRLAHAFLMTGVRGVGKTSTARLIAKALNCIGPDGQGGPTIDPCGVCEPCRAITEGRHIDVIEMDAASNTGVDDVREIIEAVRYAAVSARYKIYIIDEVHMLSRNAFNALLKTLEEPPPHVKFLFATTEVNKVPVTVLSRCQRFDLRRITPDMLFAHFSAILQKEGVEAEAPAIWLIANAAEGSVRDGLSILDQAIAHADLDGGGMIGAAQVRVMLGLSDRSSIAQLMATILEGDAGGAIDLARAQYALGIEPVAMVRGLMDLTHAITLAKVSRHDDPALAEADRERIGEWAQKLGFAPLNRLWQLLLKGHDEVLRANNPLEHLEMLLLRVIYAASMPDPGELAKLLEKGGVPTMPLAAPAAPAAQENMAAEPVAAAEASATTSPEVPASALTVAQIHQLLETTGNHRLAVDLYDHLRIIELEPGSIVFAPVPALGGAFARDLGDALLAQTGSRWHVREGEGEGRPSLGAIRAAKLADNDARIRELPVVKAALAAFPDARLVEGDDNRHRSNP